MRLGLTLGDPHGIGPELALRAWRAGELPRELVVYGDAGVLNACAQALGHDLPADLEIAQVGRFDLTRLVPGTIAEPAGRAAYEYLQAGLDAALAGAIDALVTLPMNKAATALAVPGFSGHTGVLASACGVRDYTMALVSDQVIATHVSLHVSLREALERVRRERVLRVVELTASLVARLDRPELIGVLGLNPHAGEGGQFGDEEIREIEPALADARAAGYRVAGPLPPDTAFTRALRGEFGALVCMYHDQGHLPVKTLGFDEAVNVTVGLPFWRTSVDHGTAFDIAWRGVASTSSLRRACALALRLAGG